MRESRYLALGRLLRRTGLIAGPLALIASLALTAIPATAAVSAPAQRQLPGAGAHSLALRAPALPGRTPANGRCTGEWRNVVSNVFWRRGTTGRLYWDFYLTNVAIERLGGVVTVSMPSAAVNGHAINPPYSPHTRVSTYDFHASLLNYHVLGGVNHAFKTGDRVHFVWLIIGSTGTDAYRYITCTVWKKGVG